MHLLVRSAHQLPSRTFPVVSLGAGTSFLPFIISRLDIVPILFNKAMNQLIDKKKKTFSILFPLSLFSLSLSPSSFLCLCFHPSSLVTVLFFFLSAATSPSSIFTSYPGSSFCYFSFDHPWGRFSTEVSFSRFTHRGRPRVTMENDRINFFSLFVLFCFLAIILNSLPCLDLVYNSILGLFRRYS